ncbi:MAG TPA: thrombospondin type 3 repeat-containing protein, partial [Polyangiaceae bacterium]
CPKKKGVASDDAKLNGCPPPPPPKAVAAPRLPPPPPADSDGDGIPDKLDACPNDPGVRSPVRRKNGCPVETRAKPGAAAEMTFAGFRNFEDGTSLVFVELTAPATVNMRKTRGAVIYTLENTKVPIRNNRNPLLTVDFSSIVRRATIKQVKKSVELTIVLKADVEPQSQSVQRGGATVLEIRLPKAPPGPPLPDPALAPPQNQPEKSRENPAPHHGQHGHRRQRP